MYVCMYIYIYIYILFRSVCLVTLEGCCCCCCCCCCYGFKWLNSLSPTTVPMHTFGTYTYMDAAEERAEMVIQ